jgi:hypothetical protein
MYRFKGKVMEEFGAYTIEVHHLEKLAFESDPRYTSMDSAHRLRMIQEIERTNSLSRREENTDEKKELPPFRTS